MIILTARYICNRQMRRLRSHKYLLSHRMVGYFFWRVLTSPCRVHLGMATLRLRFERKLIESNAGRRPKGRLCELRSNTHACVRKRNTPPPGGVFLLACLTRYGAALNHLCQGSNAGRRPKGRLCELRSNTHAYVRKRNTPPGGGVFLLACLTRFERAAFRVGADQTGYSKMQINKGIRRFLGFFPSIVFVTYIPKPSSIVHSSHRCVVEMW